MLHITFQFKLQLVQAEGRRVAELKVWRLWLVLNLKENGRKISVEAAPKKRFTHLPTNLKTPTHHFSFVFGLHNICKHLGVRFPDGAVILRIAKDLIN